MQDIPTQASTENCAEELVLPSVVFTNISPVKSGASSSDALAVRHHVSPMYPRKLKPEALYERRQCLSRRFASPRLLHLSPGRAHRPSSRTSLSSRLSTSHNSLVTQFADDSSFITQAISHDTLSAPATDITDMYNVPFDSDIYAVPVDMVRPHAKGKKLTRSKKRAKSTHQTTPTIAVDKTHKLKENRHKDAKTKRHSLPGSSTKKTADSDTDSLHLTLREMRKYLHTLYSSSSDSECKASVKKNNTLISGVGVHRRVSKENTPVFLKESNDTKSVETNNNHRKSSKNSFGMNIKNKKHKENVPKEEAEKGVTIKRVSSQKVKMSPVRILSMNLKQSFCNLFRWKRGGGAGEGAGDAEAGAGGDVPAAVRRALPPLPRSPQPPAARRQEDDTVTDFATSIQKVKDVSTYHTIM